MLPTWITTPVLSKYWSRSAWAAKRSTSLLPLNLMLFATDLSGDCYAYWHCSTLRTSSTQCVACARWNFQASTLNHLHKLGTSLYYQREPHDGMVPAISSRVTPTGSDGLLVIVGDSCDSLREQIHSTACTGAWKPAARHKLAT